MNCPHCNEELETIMVESAATVVTVQRITAEIEVKELTAENVKIGSAYSGHERTLISPRVEEHGDVLDCNIDTYGLELDSTDYRGAPNVYCYCPHCSGSVEEEFYSILDENVPRVPDEERADWSVKS